jgi:hypothetical protein
MSYRLDCIVFLETRVLCNKKNSKIKTHMGKRFNKIKEKIK